MVAGSHHWCPPCPVVLCAHVCSRIVKTARWHRIDTCVSPCSVDGSGWHGADESGERGVVAAYWATSVSRNACLRRTIPARVTAVQRGEDDREWVRLGGRLAALAVGLLRFGGLDFRMLAVRSSAAIASIGPVQRRKSVPAHVSRSERRRNGGESSQWEDESLGDEEGGHQAAV